jgi:DNA-damage-inducible protein J
MWCYDVATEVDSMRTTVKKDTVIRARINSKVKDEATAVLASVGLTPSSAYQLLMTRIASEKALPFSLLVPNAETIEAMRAARRGELIPVASVADLFSDVDDNDSDD